MDNSTLVISGWLLNCRDYRVHSCSPMIKHIQSPRTKATQTTNQFITMLDFIGRCRMISYYM